MKCTPVGLLRQPLFFIFLNPNNRPNHYNPPDLLMLNLVGAKFGFVCKKTVYTLSIVNIT
jgi:hypothetical protein